MPKKPVQKKGFIRKVAPYALAAGIGAGATFALAKGVITKKSIKSTAETTGGVIAGIATIRIGKKLFKIKSGSQITYFEVAAGSLIGGTGVTASGYDALAIATVLIGNNKSRKFIIGRTKEGWKAISSYSKKKVDKLRQGKKLD